MAGKMAEKQKQTVSKSLDLQQPQNHEAERAVLSAMLLHWESCSEAIELLQESDFLSRRHRVIFSAIKDLFNHDQPIDDLVLRQKLEAREELEEAGGLEYLRQLAFDVTSVALVEAHANLVREASGRRRIIDAALSILDRCYDPSVSLTEAQDTAERAIMQATEERAQEVQPLKQYIDVTMEQLQALLEGGDVRSLKTEYTTLDQLTGGFQPGELIVVAARPSMGKSTLALNMLLRIIERHGIASLLVTLEMGSDQIVRNMLSIKSRVSLHKTDEDGKGGGTFLTTDEWEQLNYAAGLIEWIPLYIDFSANMTLSRLRAVARRLKQHHDRGASQGNAEERLEPFGLIVIDYLQLLRVEGFGPSERQQMIGEISRGLKSLARELEVPVVALAQLNRSAEEADWPLLSHLRDSGSIEQDADKILFIHRPREGGEELEVESGTGVKTTIVVAKNRNGPTGNASLVFVKNCLRFESNPGYE